MVKHTGILLFIWLLMGMSSVAQEDPFQPVIKAMQDSDARKLSAHFNTAIDLGFPGNENSYSISQAEMIMRDFFRKHPADSFTVTRQGTTNGSSHFIIGDYRSGAKVFQAYILLRQVQERQRIQKIRFEDKPALSPSKHDN